MAKTGIEDLLADQASRKVLGILRDAINVALGAGKPGRKRGRPKKAAAASANGAPARKRGRPKKDDGVVAVEQGSRGEHERVTAHRGQEVVAQL